MYYNINNTKSADRDRTDVGQLCQDAEYDQIIIMYIKSFDKTRHISFMNSAYPDQPAH